MKLLTYAIKRLKNRLTHNRPMILPGIDSQRCSLQPLLKFPIFLGSFWIVNSVKKFSVLPQAMYVIDVIFPPHVLFGSGVLVLSGVGCVYGFKHVLCV